MFILAHRTANFPTIFAQIRYRMSRIVQFLTRPDDTVVLVEGEPIAMNVVGVDPTR
jgi:hypothetical protein